MQLLATLLTDAQSDLRQWQPPSQLPSFYC